MPTPATDCDAIVTSFAEIAEQSFFALAEPAQPNAEEIAGYPDWLHAHVTFRGPFSGRMTMALPVGLGYELSEAFLGTPPEDPLPPSAVADLVGELANMACGAWLTRAEHDAAFALGHPEVSHSHQPPPHPLVWVSCNGQPVSIVLALETRPDDARHAE